MKLGPNDTIILLGGWLVLKKLALWSKSQKIPIHVITSPRHSKELLEGESLKKFLENEKINYVEIDDINSSSNLNFLNFFEDSHNNKNSIRPFIGWILE